jgi:asparagine synthase (glutamine-hydrolysing)
MLARYQMQAIHINGDDAWPMKDWSEWPWNPNKPEGNAYRLLKEQVYQAAQNNGVRTVLTGSFGDHLYMGAVDWFADLLAEGRWPRAGLEMGRHMLGQGRRQMLADGDLRRVGGRLLDRFPGGRRIWPYESYTSPAWLTRFALKKLPPLQMNGARRPRRPGQLASLLGASAAWSATAEIFHASRHNLELRNPYRDRRLVEFMLSVPAHQLYNSGGYKFILRNAMKGVLPESVRCRQQPTSLLPLFKRGFLEREQARVQAILNDEDGLWRLYVQSGRQLSGAMQKIRNNIDDIETVIPWLCVSMEAWLEGLNAETSPIRQEMSVHSI